MNVLFRDPQSFKATTYDEAVVKLEKLIEQSSGPNEWAPNIISATKDLLPEYHEKFIRYLANPSGVEFENTITVKSEPQQTEEQMAKFYDRFKQTVTIDKVQGNMTFLTVHNDEDDEKIPLHNSC